MVEIQQYYTVPEVAKLLKKSKSFIYDMIGQNKIKVIRISERGTRIPASAIEEFINQQMDNVTIKHYNKSVVQPPKRGRKAHGAA